MGDTPNCLFDIELVGPPIKKIELKSYGSDAISGMTSNAKFYNQFKSYLFGTPAGTTTANLNSRMEYLFNGIKYSGTEASLKTKFKNLMDTNADDLLQSLGSAKFEQLFGVDNVVDFKALIINDINNPVFLFVKKSS